MVRSNHQFINILHIFCHDTYYILTLIIINIYYIIRHNIQNINYNENPTILEILQNNIF